MVHERDGRLRAIDHGWWKTAASERPKGAAEAIFDAVAELVEVHHPDAVAIEGWFVGADTRTALSVGQARGAVMVAAASAGVECAESPPARVKQVVCGYGRAESSSCRRW